MGVGSSSDPGQRMLENSRHGRANKADVRSANARFEDAKSRFCEFLKYATYAD